MASSSRNSSNGAAKVPRRQGGWRNIVLARLLLEMPSYSPAAHFGRVTCPVFFRVALRDHLCPRDLIVEAAAALKGGYELQERDETHLTAHATGVLPDEIAPVIAFLRRHLVEGGGGGEGVEAGAAGGGAAALEELDGELEETARPR